MGTMAQMRHVIENEYLPRLRTRPGFIRAYFLEQADDPDRALLIVAWESQAAVENFTRTNLLEASVQALAVHLPGVRIHRDAYLVSVMAGAAEEEETKPASVVKN
jgi:quinol monooxygenase YgiN